MTPEERAEKILDASCCTREGYSDTKFLQLVAAQIREAVKESTTHEIKALREFNTELLNGIHATRLEAAAKAKAYGDAAKICDDIANLLPDGVGAKRQAVTLARIIRARAKELK